MEILNSIDELVDYIFQLVLVLNRIVSQTRVWHILHHQVADPLITVEVESLVPADRWMVKLLQSDEVFSEPEDVLLLQFNLLHCVEPFCRFVNTLVHAGITTLSNFLEKLKSV
jgi:hypothetical protein